MMVNTVIELTPARVTEALKAIRAFQLASHGLAVTHAPDDVTDVQVRVYAPGTTSYFTVPLALHPNGVWTGLASPGVFPTAGTAKYLVTAKDRRGDFTVLGSGAAIVTARSGTDGEVAATAYDAAGNSHVITAVEVNGTWTLNVE